MNKKDLKNLYAKLEALEESEMGQLQGGFASLGTNLQPTEEAARNKYTCPQINNCYGGNCVAGCGGS